MEDWSKYIFDPKNPKDFKAYKLLKKILKDGNAMLVTDMYYFNILFKNEIWTRDVIDELWDVPDYIDELSGGQLYYYYLNNYSLDDYLTILGNKTLKIKETKFIKCFESFASHFEKDTKGIFFGKVPKFDEWDVNYFSQKYHQIIYKPPSETQDFNSEKNCIFGLEYGLLKDSLKRLKPNRASVFFSFKKTQLFELDFSENLHPIIIQNHKDIHKLLDFIIRDIKNETRQKPTHKPQTYLQELTIKNYFSLEKVNIKDLGDKREIYLVGENGDGKTILLQAIALALRGNKNIGAVIDIVKQNPHDKMSLAAMTNDGEKYSYQINPKSQKKVFEPLLAYGIERFRNDSGKKDEVGYLSLFNKETYLESPEEWLQHLDYKDARGDTSEISLEQAKDILRDILGKEDIQIHVTPDKVTFTEKGTTLQFDQLSDGYQSVIIWVCDLIARLSVLQPNVSSSHDYSGIVIVDEIGAYLHPKWAYSIVKKLRIWFPKIQFIFTTHNPIILLGASESEVAFYKVYKENGKTKVSEPVEDISDLMLNSLVTSPLFNLPSARPKSFDDNNDISDDDYVYRRIHQVIQSKLQDKPDLVDEEVIRMIEAELEKI